MLHNCILIGKGGFGFVASEKCMFSFESKVVLKTVALPRSKWLRSLSDCSPSYQTWKNDKTGHVAANLPTYEYTRKEIVHYTGLFYQIIYLNVKWLTKKLSVDVAADSRKRDTDLFCIVTLFTNFLQLSTEWKLSYWFCAWRASGSATASIVSTEVVYSLLHTHDAACNQTAVIQQATVYMQADIVCIHSSCE